MELTQGNTLGDWLIDEFGAPNHCREEVTLLTGTNYKTGTVLGKVTASGKYTVYNQDAVDGTETAAGILLGDADATAADKAGVALVRGPATIAKAGLTWKSDQHAADIAAGLADLLALGIVAREGV